MVDKTKKEREVFIINIVVQKVKIARNFANDESEWTTNKKNG